MIYILLLLIVFELAAIAFEIWQIWQVVLGEREEYYAKKAKEDRILRDIRERARGR